jgi:glycosyltransferase 2 family protein
MDSDHPLPEHLMVRRRRIEQIRSLRGVLAWTGLVVSAAFAYLAVRNVRLDEVWDGLRTSDYWWLAPAFAMLVLTVYVKALRWRYLFPPESRPGAEPVLSAMLIGYFFNGVLPARAGEAARVLALKQRAGTSRAAGAATVVIERTYDVLCLLVLLFLALPWLPHVTWLRAAVVLAIVLAAGLAAAIIVLAVYGVRPLHFVLRPLQRLPFLSAERIDEVGENLGRGLAALRRPRLVLGALFWTTLGWLTLAVSMWLLMRGFHLGLSLVAGLLVVIATNLVQILPSTPAAVGAFEAATLVALHAYGVPDSRALSYALVLHLLNLVPFLIVGLFLVRGTLMPARLNADQAVLSERSSVLRRST